MHIINEDTSVMERKLYGGIMGLCVADAMGVPVEFYQRETLKQNPVVDMRSFGTYNQPAGTWSDDTSLTLCLLDSLSRGLDLYDIMDRFQNWIDRGEYTPYGEVFDVGAGTRKALDRYALGIPPRLCGGMDERDNGNGSLMRILPLLFYLRQRFGSMFHTLDMAYAVIHDVSSLTHAHKRSQMACGIYLVIANFIMDGKDIVQAVQQGMDQAMLYYKAKTEFTDETIQYARLEQSDFSGFMEAEIRSTGYVVDTLEASIWCLLTTHSYQECILKAVNLGDDTDTVASVAGGLAGLYYGYQSIPIAWLDTLARREFVEELCEKFYRQEI